ncbi:MAG: hypothetical protein K2J42_06270 [Muribaculaceae bacterium]|nr:hypothetical protein [Muribaculaceae bacterium]
MVKKSKFLISLTVVPVLLMMALSLAGCTSKEKRELKKSVDQYEASLPQNVAPGVTITKVSYDSASDKVTLCCDFQNSVVAQSVGQNVPMLKAAFVPYLKEAKKGNPFITNMISANATLVCKFIHDSNTVAEFEVTADEIK